MHHSPFASSATSRPRDRDFGHIIGIVVAFLLHAIALLSLLRDAGGRAGPLLGDADGIGTETVVSAEFLTKTAAALPAPLSAPAPSMPPVVPDERRLAEEPHRSDGSTADAGQSTVAAVDAGGGGAPADELDGRYLAAVRAAVLEQWRLQGGGALPAACKVVIDQTVGGQALRAWAVQCGDLSLPERIRLEAAVMQAQPLPYAGFEAAFKEHLELTF